MQLTLKISIKSSRKDYSAEYDVIEKVKDASGYNDWEESRDGDYIVMELIRPYYTYEDDMCFVTNSFDSRIEIKSEMRDRADVIYSKFWKGMSEEITEEEYFE